MLEDYMWLVFVTNCFWREVVVADKHSPRRWICCGKEDCTILGGITISENVIVGARPLVNMSLESNAVYADAPVKRIYFIEEFRYKFLQSCPIIIRVIFV